MQGRPRRKLLYGKKTESTDGKSGYVISVNASNGKIVCFTCADENEKEFTIDVKNIVKIGDKIIYEDREHTLKNAKPVRLYVFALFFRGF